jgi:hypothetical protein
MPCKKLPSPPSQSCEAGRYLRARSKSKTATFDNPYCRPPRRAPKLRDKHRPSRRTRTSATSSNSRCELNITDKINMHQASTHAKQLQHPSTKRRTTAQGNVGTFGWQRAKGAGGRAGPSSEAATFVRRRRRAKPPSKQHQPPEASKLQIDLTSNTSAQERRKAPAKQRAVLPANHNRRLRPHGAWDSSAEHGCLLPVASCSARQLQQAN